MSSEPGGYEQPEKPFLKPGEGPRGEPRPAGPQGESQPRSPGEWGILRKAGPVANNGDNKESADASPWYPEKRTPDGFLARQPRIQDETGQSPAKQDPQKPKTNSLQRFLKKISGRKP